MKMFVIVQEVDFKTTKPCYFLNAQQTHSDFLIQFLFLLLSLNNIIYKNSSNSPKQAGQLTLNRNITVFSLYVSFQNRISNIRRFPTNLLKFIKIFQLPFIDTHL